MWAPGQANGGKPYGHYPLNKIVPGITYPLVLAPGSNSTWTVPWGINGYNFGRMDVEMTVAAGGAIADLFYEPLDSDRLTTWPFGNLVVKLIPQRVLTAGTVRLTFTFNDGPLQGNHLWLDGGALFQLSNNLNPVGFEGAAQMRFQLRNDAASVGNITITSAKAFLRG